MAGSPLASGREGGGKRRVPIDGIIREMIRALRACEAQGKRVTAEQFERLRLPLAWGRDLRGLSQN